MTPAEARKELRWIRFSLALSALAVVANVVHLFVTYGAP